MFLSTIPNLPLMLVLELLIDIICLKLEALICDQ